LSYIGQRPVVGRYIKLDQISSGFNGSNTGFSMTAGSQAVFPGTARNLLLSLGGVIQEPDTDFTISGSTLTFTTPPVANTTFFGVIYGDMQSTGTPSDGTVLPASIATSGNFSFPEVTVTGDLNIADSIVHSGDPDTKIRFGAANNFSIETGGVERVEMTGTEVVFNDTGTDTDFRIEGDTDANLFKVDASADKVGIGTASPTARFDVRRGDEDGKIAEFHTSTGFGIEISSNQTDANIASGNAQKLHFKTHDGTSSSERLTILSDGKVGIGTTSPSALLHVDSDSTTAGIRVSGDGNAFLELDADSSVAGTQIGFIDFKLAGTVEANIAVNEGVTGNPLELNSATAHNIAMVTGGGNVGIGTSSPDKLLHLSSATPIIRLTDTDTSGPLNVNIDGASGDLVFDTPSVHRDVIITSVDQTNEIIRFTGDGNVGIGTTNPSEKIHITDGNLRLKSSNTSGYKVKIGNAATGDDDFLGAVSGFWNDNEVAIVGFRSGTDTTNKDDGIIFFGTSESGSNPSTHMTIRESGDVGIGTASPQAKLDIRGAASSNFQALRLVNTQHDTNAQGGAQIKFGVTNSLGERNCRIEAKEEANNINDVALDFYTNNANSTDGETIAMRIKGNGNVGIGTTHIEAPLSVGRDVADSASLNLDNNTMILRNSGSADTASRTSLYFRTHAADNKLSPSAIRCISDGNYKSILAFHVNGNGNGTGHLESYERMRIDATSTYFNCISSPSSGTSGQRAESGGTVVIGVAVTTGKNCMEFNNPNGNVGRITSSGSNVTYHTSSDYRLKENETTISDGITRLKTLIPRRFNWKADETNTKQDGFFAHEVSSVVPEAIDGVKDAVYAEDNLDRGITKGDPIYQMIDHSRLVPLLTAALQEAIAKIETLETKVAALEAA